MKKNLMQGSFLGFQCKCNFIPNIQRTETTFEYFSNLKFMPDCDMSKLSDKKY